MERQNYWWKEAKIYELYIDKFADNLEGLIKNLDYFTALGVNTLHLLPHYPSPLVDDGYDIVDYRAVRPELGTLGDFAQFIQEAHARGIRVITDFVLNHTSDQHPWFLEASSSKDNPKRGFYIWSEDGAGLEGATNAFPDIKERNWIRNEKTGDYYFATFYPEQPDLNWDNPDVFREMLANMEFWAEMGVDGFRLDAAPYLIKREGTSSKGLPETHAVIKRIRAQLEEKYPEVILLAEAHQSVELSKQYFGDGDECHMVYHFPLMEEMWMALMFGDQNRVPAMLEHSFDIPENCQWAVFLRNHDEISLATLPIEERLALVEALDPTYQYLFKKAKATSVRIATVFIGIRRRIMEAMRLLYSVPGAPIMYYGDEIGMENLLPKDEILDTRRYVRGPFDWEKARKQIEDPQSIFSETAALIKRIPFSLPAEAVLPELGEEEE